MVSDMIFVVDNLPRLEASIKKLCNYKPMLSHQPCRTCHWIEQTIRFKVDKNVALFGFYSSFPISMFFSTKKRLANV